MTFVLSKPQEQEMVSLQQHQQQDTFSVAPSLAIYTQSRLRRRKRSSSGFRSLLKIAITVLITVLFARYFRSFPSFENTSLQLPWPDRLQKGETVGGISYYHIPGRTKASLVLLHGAAFTKEDWKTSGILEIFAKEHPGIGIVALDLPVSADFAKLTGVLDDLLRGGIIDHLPLEGLVTPSASGKSVTSWIKDSNKEQHASSPENYLNLWIPVASYSVKQCSDTQLQAWKIPTLAIYGDRDSSGKVVSMKLEETCHAKVLELPGPHPVYLKSQDAFVEAVANELYRRVGRLT